jgi:hypothetical protein
MGPLPVQAGWRRSATRPLVRSPAVPAHLRDDTPHRHAALRIARGARARAGGVATVSQAPPAANSRTPPFGSLHAYAAAPSHARAPHRRIFGTSDKHGASAAWSAARVGFSSCPPDPRIAAGLQKLGQAIRDARRDLRLTQDHLERLSGIDQTAISRLERGLSPNAPLHRLVALGLALRPCLPVGTCPHDHRCRWQPFPADRAASIEPLSADSFL